MNNRISFTVTHTVDPYLLGNDKFILLLYHYSLLYLMYLSFSFKYQFVDLLKFVMLRLSHQLSIFFCLILTIAQFSRKSHTQFLF